MAPAANQAHGDRGQGRKCEENGRLRGILVSRPRSVQREGVAATRFGKKSEAWRGTLLAASRGCAQKAKLKLLKKTPAPLAIHWQGFANSPALTRGTDMTDMTDPPLIADLRIKFDINTRAVTDPQRLASIELSNIRLLLLELLKELQRRK